jgi:hypothetical protein
MHCQTSARRLDLGFRVTQPSGVGPPKKLSLSVPENTREVKLPFEFRVEPPPQ